MFSIVCRRSRCACIYFLQSGLHFFPDLGADVKRSTGFSREGSSSQPVAQSVLDRWMGFPGPATTTHDFLARCSMCCRIHESLLECRFAS